MTTRLTSAGVAMVAPLDPLRGPSSAPSPGAPRPASGPADAFEMEFQRLLQNGNADARPDSAAAGAAGPAALTDDVAASLEGVSESLKRATAYINSARAYFKNAPSAPPNTGSVDTRS